MPVIIDVGANHGNFCLGAARRNPSARVVAFEPIPELARKLIARKLQNLEVVVEGVTATAEVRKINISKTSDWGTSSFLNFDSDIRKNEYWKQRNDLSFQEEIEVRCRPLADSCSAMGITEIDFVKIDAQGLDLEVLMSFGPLLSKVRAGMLEAPTTASNRLYEGEPDLQEILTALSGNGFEVKHIKPNDSACAEANVFFVRAGEDLSAIEEQLNLRNFASYDGRHFWHGPTSTLKEGEALFSRIGRKLDRIIHRVTEPMRAR